jgi:hypothetical protein
MPQWSVYVSQDCLIRPENSAKAGLGNASRNHNATEPLPYVADSKEKDPKSMDRKAQIWTTKDK